MIVKIELTCRDTRKYELTIEVYALHFNPQTTTFQMSYCMGDWWGLEMKCPLASYPISFDFHAGKVTIRFERQDEAEAFGAWLVEGEMKVREGFRTMQG